MSWQHFLDWTLSLFGYGDFLMVCVISIQLSILLDMLFSTNFSGTSYFISFIYLDEVRVGRTWTNERSWTRIITCYFRDEAVKVMKKLLCFKKWIELYQSCRTFLLRIARNNHNFVNFNYNGRWSLRLEGLSKRISSEMSQNNLHQYSESLPLCLQ